MTNSSDLFFGLTLKDINGEMSLSVGKLPGRKRYALYATLPETTEPLAYFNSADAAQLAITFLRHLYKATQVTP